MEVTKSILTKILSERKPDLKLALAYLSFDASPKASAALKLLMQVIAAFGTDPRKISATGRLGMRFCAMKKFDSNGRSFSEFRKLLIMSVWMRRGKEAGLNSGTLFSQLINKAMTFLSELVGKSFVDDQVSFSVEDLKEFSLDFGVKEEVAREHFVHLCINMPTLEPIVTADGLLEKPPLFNTVINHIELAYDFHFNDATTLSLAMVDPPFFDDISPYNYEVAEVFVMKRKLFGDCSQMDLVNGDSLYEDVMRDAVAQLHKAEQLLDFLSTSKRCSSPSQDEIDIWLRKFARPFPKIGHVRLPFQVLLKMAPKDAFKFSTSEFQLSSYKLWMESAELFRFSTDNILLYTAQNTVQGLSGMQQKSELWNMSSIHGPVLAKLKPCLKDIKNLGKTNSVAHIIVNRLPKGTDKLDFARLSSEYAEKWFAVDETAERAVEFAWKTQLQLEVEYILAKFGLVPTTTDPSYSSADDVRQFMDLIHQCRYEELVKKLYEHGSVVERNQFVGDGERKEKQRNYPDINKAVDEIAELSLTCCAAREQGIDAQKLRRIRSRLLDEWLPEKTTGLMNGHDDTITNFDIFKTMTAAKSLNGEADISRENEKNLMRCVYILQGSSDLRNYVIPIAFSEDSNHSTMHKLRALKAILSVVSETAVKSFSQFEDPLEQHLQELVFVAKLEKLNMSYNLKAFVNCKKPALIECLLKSCGHLPDGLSLIVDLCIAYDVFPAGLWSALLSKMCHLKMMTQLERVLIELNRHTLLWHLPAFINAWNEVLIHPFNCAVFPVTEECRQACERSIEFLQHCPVVGDINLQVLFDQCQKLQMSHLVEKMKPWVGGMSSSKLF